MRVFNATSGASGKDGAATMAPEQSTPASAKPRASAGTSPESGVGTHTESPSPSPGGGELPAAKTELNDGHGGAELAQFPPWYRRAGIAAAFAASMAAVGIVGSGVGQPGTAPGGTTGTSAPGARSFSLIATTEWWEPPPPAPPPPAAAPEPAPAPAPAPRRVAPPPASVQQPAAVPAPPPAPPPPPPPQLVFRFDQPGTATVSIINNDKPSVGCTFTSVAVAGTATMVNYRRDYPFTVTGSAATRIDPDGPATGSTFRVTVTCDNGLSSTLDTVF
jgi:hypothetical protein